MHRYAKYVSIVLGLPWVLLLIIILLFKANLSFGQLQALSLTFLVFQVAIPLGYFAWSIRNGSITDIDITKRKERYHILLISLITLFSSVVIASKIGNPLILHMLIIAFLFLFVNTFITFFWKISLHMGMNVMGSILINFLFDWKISWVYLSIPLIFWSRLVLKKHTPAQLVAGLLVSGLVTLGGMEFLGYTDII